MERRKIIEIYVEEKPEEDSVSFEFEKLENTEIADNMMKMLLYILNTYKNNDDEIEAEFE